MHGEIWIDEETKGIKYRIKKDNGEENYTLIPMEREHEFAAAPAGKIAFSSKGIPFGVVVQVHNGPNGHQCHHCRVVVGYGVRTVVVNEGESIEAGAKLYCAYVNSVLDGGTATTKMRTLKPSNLAWELGHAVEDSVNGTVKVYVCIRPCAERIEGLDVTDALDVLEDRIDDMEANVVYIDSGRQ